MIGDDESIQRSQLYNLLVQVDRKVAVVENKIANIEQRMEERITIIERQLEQRYRWSAAIQGLTIGVLLVAGIIMLTFVLTGRI